MNSYDMTDEERQKRDQHLKALKRIYHLKCLQLIMALQSANAANMTLETLNKSPKTLGLFEATSTKREYHTTFHLCEKVLEEINTYALRCGILYSFETKEAIDVFLNSLLENPSKVAFFERAIRKSSPDNMANFIVIENNWKKGQKKS